MLFFALEILKLHLLLLNMKPNILKKDLKIVKDKPWSMDPTGGENQVDEADKSFEENYKDYLKK